MLGLSTAASVTGVQGTEDQVEWSAADAVGDCPIVSVFLFLFIFLFPDRPYYFSQE